MLNRIVAYTEGQKIMDPKQDGFRKKHSTTNALLRFVQSICNSFNKEERVIACFVDLEKAYDSIWREGLLVILYEMGIKGNIWQWLRWLIMRSFLYER